MPTRLFSSPPSPLVRQEVHRHPHGNRRCSHHFYGNHCGHQCSLLNHVKTREQAGPQRLSFQCLRTIQVDVQEKIIPLLEVSLCLLEGRLFLELVARITLDLGMGMDYINKLAQPKVCHQHVFNRYNNNETLKILSPCIY
uniref:Uncharacterized protein n=1 Tax=Sphaerodactylus townsendi TaxID=933632 RepID=A0ACB8F1B4_9SAUR